MEELYDLKFGRVLTKKVNLSTFSPTFSVMRRLQVQKNPKYIIKFEVNFLQWNHQSHSPEAGRLQLCL